MRGRVGAGRRPPALVVIAAIASIALLAVPPVYLVIRAGFGDAWSVIAERQTWDAVLRTLWLVIGVSLGALVVGGSLAWLVGRTDIPLRRVWAVAAVVPLAMPSFVAALALAGATGASGLLSRATSAIGLGPIERMEGYWGATIAIVMATFPYVYLLTMAALRRVDPAQEEAARSLGKGPFGAFIASSLPQLRRGLAAGALLAGLYAISDFGAVSLMRYTTVTRAIFVRYESGFDRRPAAVLGLLLIAMTVVVLAVESRARGDVRMRTGPGARREPRRIALGRMRIPAVIWAALVSLAFVATPLGVMAYWIARSAQNGTLAGVPVGATLTSVLLAVVAALVTTLAAVPVGILAHRHARPWTRGLERSGYAANALPGIVVGLALVFLGARYLPWMYQTFPLLVFAYLIRFFAEALSGVDTAMASVNPRTEEAARVLGRTPMRVLADVTLPQMRPGLVAAVMLVFLSVIKELPATTLLLPTGARTLATEVWRKTTVGAYGAAAFPALVLVVVSLPFIAVAVREHVTEHEDALPSAND